MPLQADIQSREKSLAVLMARILQEPLRPMDQSIKKLGEELSDTQDRLKVLDDLTALVSSMEADVSKAASHSKKVLSESMPALQSHLMEHVSTASKAHGHTIESAIADQAGQTALALNAISQLLSSGLSQAASGHAETGASIEKIRLELTGTIKAFGSGIDGALGRLRQEIQLLKELSDSHRAIVALERDAADRAAVARMEKTVALCRLATSELLTEHQAALQVQITNYRQHIGRVTMVGGLLLAGILALVAFVF